MNPETTDHPPASRPVRAGEVAEVDLGDAAEPVPGPPGDFGKPPVETLEINQPLLEANDRRAAANRAWFAARGLRVVNLVSSPGAGKTTLLAATLAALAPTVRCAVLVGDLATDRDAQRLRHPQVPVVQLTTGSACHLDAAMVARGIEALDLAGTRLLFIENVGNLVCPASFDLGETVRVTLFSCTEGEDKPLKYPPAFKSAHVVVLTKLDLAAAVGCDCAAALGHARRMAPQARVLALSARTGAGLDAWLAFLRDLP